jgi:hypothetical protein
LVGPGQGPRPDDGAVTRVGLDTQGSRRPPGQIAGMTLAAFQATQSSTLQTPPGTATTNIATQATTEATQSSTLQTLQAGVNIAGDFSGRYRRSQSTISFGTNDGVTGEDIGFTGGAIKSGNFSVKLGTSTFSAPAVSGISNFSGTGASPFGAFSGSSLVTPDNRFIVIEGTESSGGRKLLGFAGTPATTFPTSGATAYRARRDFVLGSNVPFLFADAGGSLTVSNTNDTNAGIYWDTSGSSTAQRPFGTFNGTLVGTGTSQNSALGLAGGQVVTSGGVTSVSGWVRGSSQLSSQTSPHTFSGNVVSLADGTTTGNHFFGNGPSHFVVGAQSSSSLTERFQGNTTSYKPNTVFTASNYTLEARTNHLSSSSGFNAPLRGYSGGIIAELGVSSGSLISTDAFSNSANAPTDVVIQTSTATNKLRATFDVSRTSTSAQSFIPDFGDFDVGAFGSRSNTAGNSMFLDDRVFGAKENPSASQVAAGTTASMTEVYIVPADFGSNAFSGVNFCSCQFLTWGVWGGEMRTSSAIYRIHAAPWVAGVVTPHVDLPTTGTATYTGHVMANVVSGTNRYLAAGNLSVGFNFAAPSSTTISITNFDGGSFSGTGVTVSSSSGNNKFVSSTLTGASGQAGRTAQMTGSLYQNKTGTDKVAEIGGQFTASGTSYKAAGAFAAKK